jgi:hypothetical protein
LKGLIGSRAKQRKSEWGKLAWLSEAELDAEEGKATEAGKQLSETRLIKLGAAKETEANREKSRGAEPIPDGMELRIGDCREVLAEVRKSVGADRGSQISVPAAEKETRIKHQQVSRWRKALRNEEKYKADLRGPSYKMALGEKTVRGTEGTGENEWQRFCETRLRPWEKERGPALFNYRGSS